MMSLKTCNESENLEHEEGAQGYPVAVHPLTGEIISIPSPNEINADVIMRTSHLLAKRDLEQECAYLERENIGEDRCPRYPVILFLQ